MKLFLDSNIFIRYLTQDHPQHSLACTQLLNYIHLGKITPYTSNIVISEVVYVMIKIYKAEKQALLKDTTKLLSLRNLVLVEKTNTHKALLLYRNLNIKYGDCLIATQIPPNTKLCTYDEEFGKMNGLEVVKPEELLKGHLEL